MAGRRRGVRQLREEPAGEGERGINGELESLTFTVEVAAGVVSVTVERTSWNWIRGGPDEKYPDQNCGARIVETLVGSEPLREERTTESGQVGRVFVVGLEIASSAAIDRQGALCELVDWTFVEREPGSSSGSLGGIVGEWGVDATLGSIPIVASGTG